MLSYYRIFVVKIALDEPMVCGLKEKGGTTCEGPRKSYEVKRQACTYECQHHEIRENRGLHTKYDGFHASIVR